MKLFAPDEIVIVYPYTIFTTMNKEEISFKDFQMNVDSRLISTCNEFVGYKGLPLLVSPETGTRFHFGIYSNEVCLWNEEGSALGAIEIKYNEKPSLEFLEELEDLIRLGESGQVSCAGCRKPLKPKDIAGYYFVGARCNECWDKIKPEVDYMER